MGSGQGGGGLGSAHRAHRGGREIPDVCHLISFPTNLLLPDKNFSHLSGAVSMDAGVGGLALAAAVAPRAVTSLGLGGDGGHCNKKSGLRRRIVQMLKKVYKICLEYHITLQLAKTKRCKKRGFHADLKRVPCTKRRHSHAQRRMMKFGNFLQEQTSLWNT